MKPLLALLLVLLLSAQVYGGEPYEGYSEDKSLLRATTTIPSGSNSEKTIKASSSEAIQAASRLFSNVSMLFKTRDQVLAILGDPALISDYGVKAKSETDSDLVYKFDSGFGGYQFVIKFRNDVVWAIQVETFS